MTTSTQDSQAQQLTDWLEKYGQGAPRCYASDDGLCPHIGLGWNGDSIVRLQGKPSDYDGYPNSDRDRLSA